jgi:hypothetical protein
MSLQLCITWCTMQAYQLKKHSISNSPQVRRTIHLGGDEPQEWFHWRRQCTFWGNEVPLLTRGSSLPLQVLCTVHIQRMVSNVIQQESEKIICIAMNHSQDCLTQHVKLIEIFFTSCMHMALIRAASQIQSWSNTYQCNQRSLLFISGYMSHQRQILYKSTCLSLWSITGTQHSPLQHKTTLRKGMNNTYYLLSQIESSDLLM